MRRSLVVLLVAVLSLSGCSAGGSAPSAHAPSVASSASAQSAGPAGAGTGAPSAAATQQSAPAPAATAQLVQFSRQGGLVGRSELLSIQDNGAFTLNRLKPRPARQTGTLTAAELANLRQALSSADVRELPKQETASGMADAYTYTVTYGGYQIVAQEGAVAAPLRPAIDALSAILSKYGG